MWMPECGSRVETRLPLDDVRITARLANGRLWLTPLNFGVGDGEIRSRLALDGSERPVQAEIETEITQVALKAVLRSFGFAQETVGHLGGRVRLKATGDSLAELLAAADGRLSQASRTEDSSICCF